MNSITVNGDKCYRVRIDASGHINKKFVGLENTEAYVVVQNKVTELLNETINKLNDSHDEKEQEFLKMKIDVIKSIM